MKLVPHTATFYRASDIFTNEELDTISECGSITWGDGVHTVHHYDLLVDEIENESTDRDDEEGKLAERIAELRDLLPGDTLIDLEN